jgi:hypothetical protein
MRKLTKEQIAELKQRVIDGESQADLAEEYGISVKAVSYHKNHGKRAKVRMDKCPNCKHKLPEVAHMAFCPFCGGDIRSESIKAVEGLRSVLNHISTYYPMNLRDEAVAALNKAIRILEEEC